MRNVTRGFLCAASLFLWSAAADAGQVTVDGVHLCCGACVTAVNEALTGVEGVTEVAVDKDTATVKFAAANEDAVKAGIQALAKAGFGGAAKHDGKDLKYPKGYKEDAKSNEVTIRGIHNCCPGCAKAIEGALKGVTGVESVKCEKKTCTVTGKDLSYSALITALHDEGLHGNIPAPKAE
jgi:copper chaperone CopZ